MARRFANPDPQHRVHRAAEVFRWAVLDRLTGRRVIGPPGPPARRVRPDLSAVHDVAGPPRLTWIGHASFLVSLGGPTLLIDPVFSERVAVVPRHVGPGLLPGDLPAVGALLVTHSHYDHLDRASVCALDRDTDVVVPLGLARWFRRRGFRRVTELDWWETTQAGGSSVTLVPARHWSRRSPLDTNRTLWGGFVVEAGGVRIYHAGDSGWFDGFAEIGRRFPGLQAALLPVGAYAPAWFMEPHHMNPEQAILAFDALDADHLVPMHWGTFRLTDEPLSEPRRWLEQAWARRRSGSAGLHVMDVGETLVLDPDRGVVRRQA